MLRISGGMHLDTILSRLHHATKDDSSLDRLSCLNLHFGEEEKQALIVTTLLRDLLQSRSWKSLEFLHCQDMKNHRIILADDEELLRTETLSWAGSSELFVESSRLVSSKYMTKLHLNVVFTFPAMQAIAKGLKESNTLQHLDLSLSSFLEDSSGGVLELCQGLRHNESLQVLTCNRCRLSDNQVSLIVQSIAQQCSLKELNLKGNTCRSLSLRALTTTITMSPHLQCLRITNDELSEDRVSGLTDFFRALQFSSSLQVLSLGEYMILDDDMQSLVESLALWNTNCPPLSDLSLLSCGMTANGIRLFAAHISSEYHDPTRTSLRSLAIPGDAANLMDLERNFSLQTLDTGCEDYDSSLLLLLFATMQSYYLDLNRGGRRLLKEQHIQPSLWPILLAKAQQRTDYYGGPNRCFDVIYCLLRGRVLLEHTT